MERVVVVILNYNGKHLLEIFLPKIIQYSLPYRIVIVDNASQDDSVNFLAMHYADIECIQHAKNEGFANGYNLALQKIKAQYYILINTDIEVTNNWISPLLQVMESSTNIVACQPKILSYSHKSLFEYAGAAGGFIDILGYPFCRGRIFSSIEEDKQQYNDTRQIFWTSGACMIMRSTSFWEIGGFDSNLFAYYEEIDLCWRLHYKDYKIFYCGKSTVYHVGSATVGVDNPYKTYLHFRNRALVLYKNTPKHFLSWKHILRIILDLVVVLRNFLQAKPQHAKATLKAQLDFFKLKKYYTPIHSTKKLNYIYHGLLPIDFFIFRKKTFTDLSSKIYIK